VEYLIHFLMIELTIDYRTRWLILAGHFCSKKSGSKTNKINIVERKVSMIGGRFGEYFSRIGTRPTSRSEMKVDP
jgi:hypothetical protein